VLAAALLFAGLAAGDIRLLVGATVAGIAALVLLALGVTRVAR
jgi:hypothetical protein